MRALKLAVFIISLSFTDDILAQENPFLKLDHDSVVIYDFEWRDEGAPEHFSIIGENGKLAPTVKKSVKLGKNSAIDLSKKVGSKISYGQSEAACFEPHLGIVYYKKGKPAAHITICIACNRLVSSITIPAQQQGKQIADDGTAYYTMKGLSKSFRSYLDKLLEKHNFSHRPKPGSMFDE